MHDVPGFDSPESERRNVFPWITTILTTIVVASLFPIQNLIFGNVSFFAGCFYFGVIIAPCSVFGLWLGLSSNPLRFLLFLPLAILGAGSASYVDGPFQLSELMMPFLTTVSVFLTFELIKTLFGIRVSTTGSENTISITQFSVMGLMVITAIAAAFHGAYNYASESLGNSIPSLMIFVAMFSSTTTMSSLVLLSARRLLNTLVIVPAGVIVVMLSMWALQSEFDDYVGYGLSFVTSWCIVIIQLIHLRQSGYRLVPASR